MVYLTCCETCCLYLGKKVRKSDAKECKTFVIHEVYLQRVWSISLRLYAPPLGARELCPPRKNSVWRHGQAGESCVRPEKRAHDVMDRLAISQKSKILQNDRNCMPVHDVMRSFFGAYTTLSSPSMTSCSVFPGGDNSGGLYVG